MSQLLQKETFQHYNVENTVFLDIADATLDVNLRLYWNKVLKGREERPLIKTVRKAIINYFAKDADNNIYSGLKELQAASNA